MATNFALLLLVFLPIFAIDGAQVALRSRPTRSILSREFHNTTSIFEPTSEEVFFYQTADRGLLRTIHKHPKRKYVNFEKFENYLPLAHQLCTPSSDNKTTTLLSFPFSGAHYSAARASWEGRNDLVFIGHDPSCFHVEEERSKFRALSIAFDDASHTVQVIGKPLGEKDKHYPWPSEIVYGKAPADIQLARSKHHVKPHAKRDCLDDIDFDDIFESETYEECFVDMFGTPIGPGDVPILTLDLGKAKPKDQLWPPDDFDDHTPGSLPEVFIMNCLDCKLSGKIDMEFRLELNVPASDDEDEDEDEDEDDDKDEDDEDDDFDVEAEIRKLIKRAYFNWEVTKEVKIRNQISVDTTGAANVFVELPLYGVPTPGVPSVNVGYTLGGQYWEKTSASAPKKEQADNLGKTEVKNPAASVFGWDIWPLVFAIEIWANIGVAAELNMTLPGFEAIVPVGDVMEATIIGDASNDPSFNPSIVMLPADLSIKAEEIHFNIAFGPKIAVDLGIPAFDLGAGFGARVDLIRFDTKFGEFLNVSTKCEPPSDDYVVNLISGKTFYDTTFGFTVDLKTGVFVYVNFAGFFIDTGWLGDTVGGDFPGLYWGIKNLVAVCVPCGDSSIDPDSPLPCLSTYIDEFLDKAVDKFEWVTEKLLIGDLEKSTVRPGPEGKNIENLDMTMEDVEMPVGDPDYSCVSKSEQKRDVSCETEEDS